ncbi:MAG TPA: glycoside hydrolase family 25 protein [Candidatus Mediterraneibacter faecigallinarum]|jgi:GH25 family lysozyme M1 (1,4-beta-N-acetylmuramidase)|uniref:Glycoside hydrolase family 25 protein n=1 Tax=Candidatus Mediterraneibacter faecigallinarum TaxID=2838669 RepID=A0A9D2NW56_9FIRM|nr:glycoside hydrolase family 25 protein [Candidatus Mediterraneibacter faecigallinarum]
MNTVKILITALCCVLFLSACVAATQEGDKGEQEDSTTGVKTEEKDGKEFFVFQDVEENSYRAELLENVPRNTYDFSKLHTDEQTGFKTYEDEENGVTSRIGIDVSEFQGEDIDWKQVRESGIEFVIIRLGYRAYGETGELVLDDMFDRNMQGALDAGLDVGVYFFSQAITPGEAVEEAEFVLEHVRGYEIDGPIVYDTEEIKGDTARTDNNTRQEFTNYCKVFCDTIEQAGYDPMIYANMKWMAFTLDMEQLADYDFWYADYHDVPQCPYEYEIWQYSETGAVPGINANVDLNVWFQKSSEDE